MNKQEFEAKLGQNVKRPTDSEYAMIEKVYTYHPSIKDVGGKEQIATLYAIGGIRLIMDMLPTALRAQEFEDEIRIARGKLQKLQDDFAAFVSGEGK